MSGSSSACGLALRTKATPTRLARLFAACPEPALGHAAVDCAPSTSATRPTMLARRQRWRAARLQPPVDRSSLFSLGTVSVAKIRRQAQTHVGRNAWCSAIFLSCAVVQSATHAGRECTSKHIVRSGVKKSSAARIATVVDDAGQARLQLRVAGGRVAYCRRRRSAHFPAWPQTPSALAASRAGSAW